MGVQELFKAVCRQYGGDSIGNSCSFELGKEVVLTGSTYREGSEIASIPYARLSLIEQTDGMDFPEEEMNSAVNAFFERNQKRLGRAGPRMLPINEIEGKLYFYDERLHEYRNVKNPHDVMSEEGR
jgi:hypothetical protein